MISTIVAIDTATNININRIKTINSNVYLPLYFLPSNSTIVAIIANTATNKIITIKIANITDNIYFSLSDL